MLHESIRQESIPQQDFNVINNHELLLKILDRLDKIEKTFISINADLINQNIKMSEIINGKLKEPDFEMPESKNEMGNASNASNVSNVSNTGNGGNGSNLSHDNYCLKEKELYYYENNGKIIVHGPGTFDNRPILKQYGEWNSFNKSWDLTVDINILIDKIPKLIKKEKISLINNE
jgi:hypothetical protein